MARKPDPTEAGSQPLNREGDDRVEARREALRAADIVLGDGRPAIACLIKDASKSGFRLLVDTPLQLPDVVQLVLSHPTERHVCRLVWQKEGEIGVQIVG